MSEEVFYKNIERRIIDIAVQDKHASQKGISNQAKSGYYRFAILLACTIVEALLFRREKKTTFLGGLFVLHKLTQSLTKWLNGQEYVPILRK